MFCNKKIGGGFDDYYEFTKDVAYISDTLDFDMSADINQFKQWCTRSNMKFYGLGLAKSEPTSMEYDLIYLALNGEAVEAYIPSRNSYHIVTVSDVARAF